MKCAKLLVTFCVLVLAANAFAVYTPHIWDRVDANNYPYDNKEYPGTQTIYVKSAPSSPDNSPLHESANLVDEFIDGNPNPYFIGDTTGVHPGLFYRFIFYGANTTLHIDPTGKVGFWEKMFACGSTAGNVGNVIVEGHLFGHELRPWKNGSTMKLYVMDGGLLELNLLRLGYSEGTPDTTGEFYLSGGLAMLQNLTFWHDASAPGPSFIDVTGGELLILNSNWSVADVEAAIAAGEIFNSNADEGYVLDVATRDVDGTLYTSVMVKFDPLSRALYLLGAAIDQKAHAMDDLSNAMAMEATAGGFFKEVLSTLEPGTPDYLTVETAKAWTLVALVGEKAAQRKINHTVLRLEDVLALFEAEPPAGGAVPSLEDLEVEMADLNVDGVIDLEDFALLTAQWLGSYEMEW
jgi:hypothetical protein